MKSPRQISSCSNENFCFQVGDYSFGFNGKDKESEFNSGAYDFGARILDTRLGRWMSVDLKVSQNATWSPYVFAIDNPIIFVDHEGHWPGITFFYGEFDIGAGLSYGLNYVEQTGFAEDEVGETHFVMVSALYIVNQNLQKGSANAQPVIGLSVGLTVNVKQNWSAETFYGLVSKAGIGLPIPYGADLGAGVAVNFGFNSDEFVIGGGFGAGAKLSVINTSIKESISLTDDQSEMVSEATDVIVESWGISGSTQIVENGKLIGFQAQVVTYNSKGETIYTGISVTSGVIDDGKGNATSNGVWHSAEYKNAAIIAEQKDKK